MEARVDRPAHVGRSLRLLLSVSLLLTVLALPGTAEAQPPGWDENWGEGPPSSPAPIPVQRPGHLWWTVTSVGTEEEFGERCWRMVAERRDEEPPENRSRPYMAERLATWDVSGVAYEACPITVSPDALALELWVSMRVEGVSIDVAPGRALTGMPAYLVLDGQGEQTASTSGGGVTIAIRAWPEYLIDWGDGSAVVGPTTSRGVPWHPDGPREGAIVHTYQDAATRTITVTTRWHAEFTAPGIQRALPVRETVDTHTLEVRQVQAVRTSH